LKRPRATQRNRVGNNPHPAERFTEQKWLLSYFVRPVVILVMMMPGGLVSTGRGVEGTQQTKVGLHRTFSNEDTDELQGC
jgi:hypothetical protein